MNDPFPSPSSARPPDGQSGGRAVVAKAIIPLTAAALLGGGIAVGGAAALGAFDSTTTTTVVERAASAAKPAATGGDLSAGEIYNRANGAVVQITTQGAQQGLGSGFVIDETGHIVTNFHVIDGASSIEVSFSNQDTLRATVVGSDPSTDLAVLKVDAGSQALTPLTLADSDKVAVGDAVVAIGNPFGLERTITAGIVSALQRAVTAPNGYTIDHVIQTDAPINPGNSGGPLIDGAGEVIGVNSQIETGNGGVSGNVGIGFAVPSNTVKSVVAQILADGSVDRAYIGVTLQDVDAALAQAYQLPVDAGVLVQTVQPDSPAAAAGLEPGDRPVVVDGQSATLGGDLIVAIDGTRVASLSDLRDVLAERKPGDTVKLEVYRGDTKKTVSVTLGQQP